MKGQNSLLSGMSAAQPRPAISRQGGGGGRGGASAVLQRRSGALIEEGCRGLPRAAAGCRCYGALSFPAKRADADSRSAQTQRAAHRDAKRKTLSPHKFASSPPTFLPDGLTASGRAARPAGPSDC